MSTAWALHCMDAAFLTVYCMDAGAERAREHLLERARRVCQLVPEQERDQAAERQRLVEAPLVAQAPYRRHAAIRVARKDDAMNLGSAVFAARRTTRPLRYGCALEMHTSDVRCSDVLCRLFSNVLRLYRYTALLLYKVRRNLPKPYGFLHRYTALRFRPSQLV